MSDAALVGRLLDEYHDRPATQVRLLAGSQREERVAYSVTLPDGQVQVIRAFRADEPVPVHAGAMIAEPVSDWLLGRARTLAWLERHGYPAPRPVRTRTGELIAVAGSWLAWATTFVSGPVARPTLAQLWLTGAALGRLHSVPVLAGPVPDLAGGGEDDAPGPASRHPGRAVPVTRARLERVASLVPAAWRPLYAQFIQVNQEVGGAAGGLAEVIVHGDVWARNVVVTDPADVTFIDWESGGLGLAVLDLGNSLLECHLDSELPGSEAAPWLITPDPDRIAALAGGYASVRPVTGAELELLPAAAKFAAAVVGAIHFEAALVSGVSGAAMDARLARLQNRIAAAGPVADIARRALASG